MKLLSGHMIIKNGIKFDYPFVESCLSILPICDEFVFVEGEGDDGTYERLLELQSEYPDKIKVHRRPWVKEHFSVLVDMTDQAIELCTSKYHFQIQADEIVHEKYLNPLHRKLKKYDFDYGFLQVKHFFGNFNTIYKPGVFYDEFIRIGRRSCFPQVCSYGDAMSLGTPRDDPNQFCCRRFDDIAVYHYGYVRKPKCLIEKQQQMTRWWGYTELDPYLDRGLQTGQIKWDEKHPASQLLKFEEGHPEVLKEWVAQRDSMVANGEVV